MTSLQNRPALGWDNPPDVAARGTVIVVPGRGEHPGVYERFGSRLAFDAYRVRAVGDPIGNPQAAHDQVRELLDDPGLPGPRVLVGSDSGALFALGIAARGGVEAVITAGLPTPTARLAPLDWEAELDQRTACSTHRGRLTSDSEVRRGALAEEIPADWFEHSDPAGAGVPVLGLHGAGDRVSALEGVAQVYRNASNASLFVIKGGRHDVLNDATHRTTAATIVLFLERLRLGAALPQIARSA